MTFDISTHPAAANLSLPAFRAWLCMTAGMAVAHVLPWPAPELRELLLILAGCSLLAGIALPGGSRRYAAMGIAGACVLLAGRGMQEREYRLWRKHLAVAPTHLLTGRVAGVATPSFGRYTYVVRCDSVYAPGFGAAFHGRLIRCIADAPPEYGHAVVLRGSFRPPRPPLAPGAFNEYRYCMAGNIWGVFNAYGQLLRADPPDRFRRVAQSARRHVHSMLALVPDAERRSLLHAALLGERGIDRQLKHSFSRAGISHLLAISGLHVGIVSVGLLSLLGLLPLSARERNAVAIVALWCYVLLVGPLPSLVRAAIMVTLLLSGPLLQRQSDSLNALGVAGILWLVLAPESLFTPGFQLSFAATLAIILAVRRAKDALENSDVLSHPLLRLLAPSALVSTAAFIGTAPIMAYHFGTLSLYGLVANLFVVSLMTAVVWLCGISLMLLPVSLQLTEATVRIADMFLSSIVWIAEQASAVPLLHLQPFSLPLLLAYGISITGLLFLRGRHALRTSAAAALVCIVAHGMFMPLRARAAPLEVAALAAGRGDSIVVAVKPGGNACMAISAPSCLASVSVTGAIDSWLRHRGARLTAVLAADTGALRATLHSGPLLHRIRAPLLITSEPVACAPGCSLMVGRIPAMTSCTGSRDESGARIWKLRGNVLRPSRIWTGPPSLR